MNQTWLQELMTFAGVKSTFIIEGNINDVYPFNDKFGNLEQIIRRIFRQIDDQETEVSFLAPEAYERNAKDLANGDAVRTELLQPAEDEKAKTSVISMSSRLCSNVQHPTQDEKELFIKLYDASLHATSVPQNTLILLVDKLSDIPPWFHLNNPHVRILSIPIPSRKVRLEYIQKNYGLCDDVEKERLADLTEGMKLVDLEDLKRLNNKLKIQSASRMEQMISTYKYGCHEEIWGQHRSALMDYEDGRGTLLSRIEEHVKGQREAVEAIIRMLRRAVSGLSGLQHSSNSKPKVVAFLAGPTGVGKTELVKTIARLLYHDERAIIRFDMSEYNHEHADQKLVGSPPGYVGYEAGGELTNAVRRNPQGILLFDEAEKACPSIFNKFLQILEDGRLTDGQGKTVSFSDTMIFFTSNIGMTQENCSLEYDQMKEKVLEAMNCEFKPEMVGRIGDNIIVFHKLDDDAARGILSSQLDKISSQLITNREVEIIFDEDVKNALYDIWKEKFQDKGGRGIGNVVEKYYLNTLGDYMFTADFNQYSRFRAKWNGEEEAIFYEPIE